MNKKVLPIAAMAFFAAAMITLGSCQNATRTYAKELKAEKKLIEQFVERNNITIIYEEPEYDQWKENEYLELEEYCYFHLTTPGDTTKPALETNDRFNLRYRQYTLTEEADTLSYWNTNESAYPMEYNLVELYSYCEGLYWAVQKLKYTGAEGKLICPSRYGSNSYETIPYGYDIKLQIRRF